MAKSPNIPVWLEAAQKGDEAALAAAIAQFMPLIQRLAAKATVPGLDRDDAVQEGLIGLFNAIEHYNPGNNAGAGFATYASTCIQNAMSSAKKAAGRKKHAPLNHSVPLEEEQAIPGPEEQAIASEQVSSILRRARENLSPFEKQVLGLYLDGYAYAEIAVKLNRSPKSVDNAMLRIRRKLK